MADRTAKATTTLDAMFVLFAKFMNSDPDCDGKTITFRQLDRWFQQARLVQKTIFTATDMGVAFFKYKQKQITYNQFLKFLDELCKLKHQDLQMIKDKLCNCGTPVGKKKIALD